MARRTQHDPWPTLPDMTTSDVSPCLPANASCAMTCIMAIGHAGFERRLTFATTGFLQHMTQRAQANFPIEPARTAKTVVAWPLPPAGAQSVSRAGGFCDHSPISPTKEPFCRNSTHGPELIMRRAITVLNRSDTSALPRPQLPLKPAGGFHLTLAC